MANPQVENGFIQIASGKEQNDVLMALIKQRLNGTQYQIMLLVIRKTWGFKKNEDWISLTQFERYLSKSRPSITNEIKRLVKNNLLVKKSKPGINALYGINKDFSQWKSLVKKTLLGKKTYTTSKENLHPLVKKTLPTKETLTKDIIQKKVHVEKQRVPAKEWKRKPEEKRNKYERIVYFLEDTLNTKIVNWGKQNKAINSMLQAGYKEEHIKRTITYMATKDDFFYNKGFDLMTVSNQISRYKAEFSKNNIGG